jgi:phosphoenolpyruvate carboxykinase (ATP)
MSAATIPPPTTILQKHNLSTIELLEEAVKQGEGWLSSDGAFIAHTGEHTGRSSQDKYVVQGPIHGGDIWWASPYQKPLSQDYIETLHQDVLEYLQTHEIYTLDAFAGADPQYRLNVRVITELAWHSLFSRHLFIPTTPEEAKGFTPDFTVISLPSFKSNSQRHGSRSSTQIVISFKRKLVIIVGTSYAGEIKKSIFTVLNHLLPARGVLPMHCSANVGKDGDAALFFGMSGTGKTTLSADPERKLIGDDEHGWSDKGIFNFEGGCYAKVINLSREAEPQIYEASQSFGAVLENVTFDAGSRHLNFADGSLTENTRAAYPLSLVPNAQLPSVAGHPSHIIFLTADAFGVLPPVAKLTSEQAMEYFLNGYTAKVAGTEKGILEPQASFETAFGAPFLTREPNVYASLLNEKIKKHNARVWLVNTGWTGGPYGTGRRIKLEHTRGIVKAILDNRLVGLHTTKHSVFGLETPVFVPGVPNELLNPRETWQDKEAYDIQASRLAALFAENIKQFKNHQVKRTELGVS